MHRVMTSLICDDMNASRYRGGATPLVHAWWEVGGCGVQQPPVADPQALPQPLAEYSWPRSHVAPLHSVSAACSHGTTPRALPSSAGTSWCFWSSLASRRFLGQSHARSGAATSGGALSIT